MTGFRLARGGAQELLGIKADIATYGKVLGGGLPVGAFAARNEIMKYLAPEGPIYQAGTLSGNPLAMSAGLSMLKALYADNEIYQRLNKKTERLERGFRDVLNNKNIPYHINRLGSMISLHFTDKVVFDFETAASGDSIRFNKYFHGMLNKGIYLPPSSYESYFLNDALTNQDIDKTVNCFAEILIDL
jgi:glutamate-1-semialdehyde 2,1-aminomutase